VTAEGLQHHRSDGEIRASGAEDPGALAIFHARPRVRTGRDNVRDSGTVFSLAGDSERVGQDVCFDVGEWRQQSSLRKHLPKPNYTRSDVVKKEGRRSMYFPDQDVAELERHVAMDGVYLSSTGKVTIHKIHEFEQEIGVSEGNVSRWALVESTSGTFHGYPISQQCFENWMKDTRECCNERSDG
jgi:hypothetical protein